MAKITDSLKAVQPVGRSRLSGVKGASYQAANPQADMGGSSRVKQLAQSLSGFMGAATQAGTMYVDHRKDEALANTKKIMDRMTPEQIRMSRESGTLMAQDDPFTNRELNYQLAQMESDSVYSEMMTQVNDDKLYPTKDSFMKALSGRLTERQAAMQKEYGVGIGDESWDMGWNSDVLAKNISLMGQLDQRDDKIARSKAKVVRTQKSQSILTDKSLTPESATLLINKSLDADLQSGIVRSTAELNDSLVDIVKIASEQPNGVAMLEQLKSRSVDFFGQKISYEEAIGEAQWSALEATAKESVYKNDWRMAKDFINESQAIELEDDPMKAQQLWLALREKTARLQGDEKSTPRLEAVERMGAGIANKAKAFAARKEKQILDDQRNTIKQQAIGEAYSSRIQGGTLRVNPDDMSTNEFTGKYTPEDFTNYANNMVNEIEADPNLNDVQKTSKIMSYAKADEKDGPFRRRIGTVINDAQMEWDAAVLNPKSEKPLTAINKLASMYKVDPSSFDQLYPEMSSTLIKMNTLSQYGIDREMLVNQSRYEKDNQTPEKQRLREQDWVSVTNGTAYKQLQYLPQVTQATLRTVFEAHMNMTGNSKSAAQAAVDYLNKNMVEFKTDGSEGSIGLISKSDMSFSGGINDHKFTQRVLNTQIESIRKANPAIGANDLTVSMAGENIVLKDYTGSEYYIYTKGNLSRKYDEELRKSMEVTGAQKEKAIRSLMGKNKKSKGPSDLLTNLFGS